MNHFVLIYDQAAGLLLNIENFGQDGEAALSRRFELDRQYAASPGIEVVLLSGQSEQALQRTHARYFKSVNELMEPAV